MTRQKFPSPIVFGSALVRCAAIALLALVASADGGPLSGESIIFTMAGNGLAGFGGDGALATKAMLNFPGGVAVDGSGNVYVADLRNQRIRKVGVDGIITTVAGNGQASFSGDGGPAIAAALNLMGPVWTTYTGGVAVDRSGNIYIADTNNNRVRKVGLSGVITTVAGSGERDSFGDDGPAVLAALAGPGSVAIDSGGNLFIADTGNNAIRKVSAEGNISTVVSNVLSPVSVALDPAGNIYAASNADRVVKVGPDGQPVDVGTGWYGPWGLAADREGNVYVANSLNQRIDRISPDGSVTTVAGRIGILGLQGYMQPGFSGDGEASSNAAFAFPLGVALDNEGNLYVADAGNNRIRKIAPVPPGTPFVVSTAFSRNAVSQGGAFSATFSGVNIADGTYFDVRYRAPGTETDVVALNWQKGSAVEHQLALGTAAGDWKITGVRAHRDVNDHIGVFAPTFALLTVSPSTVTRLELDPGTVPAGSPFTGRFSGSNLTADTYFDVRFRSPCSAIDEIVRNWQRGTASAHTVTAGLPPGTWTITGAWPHEDIDEHSATFFPVTAVLAVSGSAATVSVGGPITSLVLDPRSPNIIYAANSNGVYKSCDAGQVWSPATSGLPAPETLTLAIDPVNSDVLYVGTKTAGVFKTVNGGAFWTSVRSGLPSGGIRALAINPGNSAIVYAATEVSGVFKSIDGGENWSPANSGLPSSTTFQSLAIDPVQPDIVYAGTDILYPARAQVFKSADGGNHWESTWLPASSRIDAQTITALAVDAKNPSVIYAATNNPDRGPNSNQPGIFKSVDGGATWTGSASGGPGHRYIASLAIDPVQPATVYAGGMWSHQLFRSTDAGNNWTGQTIFLKTRDDVYPSLRALAIDPSNPSILYTGAPEGVFKSTDRGLSWQRVGN
jgi:NHL repeat